VHHRRQRFAGRPAQQAQKALQKLRMPVKPKTATIKPIKTF
jgi:hypothetical protein